MKRVPTPASSLSESAAKLRLAASGENAPLTNKQGKRIVSSEELEESSHMTPLSNLDKTAKDYAVQQTLAKLRGGSSSSIL